MCGNYESFLRRLSQLDPNVTVLRDELPQHPAEDYLDYYHISQEVRGVFTRQLAVVLAGRFGLPLSAGDR